MNRRARPAWGRLVAGYAGLVAALAVLPVAFPGTYARTTLTLFIAFGIFAMSLDLLLGYAGMPSLGHAAFFGIGAYVAAILALRGATNLLMALLVGSGAAAVAALVIGWISLRARGVYFLMLTLALGQMVSEVASQWTSVTGGSDGLSNIPHATLGTAALDASLAGSTGLYVAAGLILLGVTWLLRHVTGSPFGRSLLGIRENETRLMSLGVPTHRTKLAAFVLAGALAGVGGVVFAFANGYVSAGDANWVMSANALVMVIVGGPGTLLGPLVGAGVFTVVQFVVSLYFRRWEAVMGLVFIVFVYLGRGGIAGFIRLLAGSAKGRAVLRGGGAGGDAAAR